MCKSKPVIKCSILNKAVTSVYRDFAIMEMYKLFPNAESLELTPSDDYITVIKMRES